MSDKFIALDAMNNYAKEVRIQVENLLVGKPVTSDIETTWKACLNSITALDDELRKILTKSMSAGIPMTDAEAEANHVNCDKAQKIRQAIKICSSTGEVYWMWKLQPGEKIPKGYYKV